MAATWDENSRTDHPEQATVNSQSSPSWPESYSNYEVSPDSRQNALPPTYAATTGNITNPSNFNQQSEGVASGHSNIDNVSTTRRQINAPNQQRHLRQQALRAEASIANTWGRSGPIRRRSLPSITNDEGATNAQGHQIQRLSVAHGRPVNGWQLQSSHVNGQWENDANRFDNWPRVQTTAEERILAAVKIDRPGLLTRTKNYVLRRPEPQPWEVGLQFDSDKVEAAKEVINGLVKVQTQNEQTIENFKESLKAIRSELRNLSAEREQHGRNIASLKDTITSVKHQARLDRDNQATKHTREISQLKRTAQSESLNLQKTLEGNFTKDFTRLEQNHKAEITQSRQAYETHVSNLQQYTEKLKRDHAATTLRNKNEHESTLAEQASNYQAEIRKLHQNISELKQNYAADLAQKTNSFKNNIAKQASDHETLMQNTCNEYNDIILKNREASDAKIYRLGVDIEELKTALMTKDDDRYRGELFTTSGLPSDPDDQISKRFSAIEQMVETLGRLKWKTDPVGWTGEMLQALCGDNSNDRLLKKAIVKDLIWSLLYHYIFASPFRVLNELGKSLENQWSSACGQESALEDALFTWPFPNTKTERWRYMTIRECREALEPPVPSDFDPRSRVRKGLVEGIKEFLITARTCLKDLIDLSKTELDLLRNLAKQAATMWLEFANYRCRILIRLKGPTDLTSTAAKIARAQSGSLELTLTPELGRFGDTQGADMEKYTVINGQEGSSTTVHKFIGSGNDLF